MRTRNQASEKERRLAALLRACQEVKHLFILPAQAVEVKLLKVREEDGPQ